MAADFSKLYDDYADKVYRYLLGLSRDRHRAAELTQETFFRALQSLHQYQGHSSFYTWLCRIGKNLFLDEEKKRKRVQQPLSGQETADQTERPPEHALLERERLLSVHKALHKLKDPYREVFSLKIFGELKYREIAELFDKSESWAKVTYFRAKEQIVKEMEAEGWL